MSTRPPAPPPRGPRFTPPDEGGSTLRTVLKVVAWIVGGLVLLSIVGTGLLFAICTSSK